MVAIYRFSKLLAVIGLCAALGACSTPSQESSSAETTTSGTQASQPPVMTDAATSGVDQTQLDAQEFLDQRVGDRVWFATDSAELTEEARATLHAQAEWLRSYTNITVTIEGHTDERGTRQYNLALGERRAAAVRNYMVALGIDPRRIQTISYGKERPVVLGTDAHSWALNRRSVTLIN